MEQIKEGIYEYIEDNNETIKVKNTGHNQYKLSFSNGRIVDIFEAKSIHGYYITDKEPPSLNVKYYKFELQVSEGLVFGKNPKIFLLRQT